MLKIKNNDYQGHLSFFHNKTFWFLLIQDKQVITFKRGDVIKLPLKRKQNRVYLAPEVAKQIVPREIQPGVNISTLTACLQVKDNLHDIKAFEETVEDKQTAATSKKQVLPPTRDATLRKRKYELGQLDVDLLVNKLMQEGIMDIKIENSINGQKVIKILSDNTSIVIDDHSTHIQCNGKQSTRLKLREIIMQCLMTF